MELILEKKLVDWKNTNIKINGKNITKKHKIRLENGQLFDMWGECNSSDGFFKIKPVEE